MQAIKLLESLSFQACQLLAQHLPDGPQTVISRAHLRWGTARAYALGLTADGFETAVVEDPGCPGEPVVFGTNPQQIADLLTQIPDWFCVSVAPDLAQDLKPILRENWGTGIRQLVDIYHVLHQPPPASLLSHPHVRLLTIEDLAMLQAAIPELRGDDPHHMLLNRAAAGVIIQNTLVAIAQIYALTEGFGDVGVFTLPAHRSKGYAAAAAARVANWLQKNGRIPVWSCGEHNQASRRVAAKLGFVASGQRVYLILER